MQNLKLQSKRIKLIPFTQDDVKIFRKINSDPFVRKFMWDDQIMSLETSKDIMSENQRLFTEKHYGIWKIFCKQSDNVIGYCGLWFFFDEPQPQLLYAILEPYTGQGLATAAAHLVIDYAFTKLDFNYLLAATDEPNKASQKVATRLGMRRSKQVIENGKVTIFYRIEK